MNEIDKQKYKQLNDIVAVVKISTLLFTGMIIIQYFFNGGILKDNILYSQYGILLVGFITCLLLFIYVIWKFYTPNKVKNKHPLLFQIIENITFVIIFSVVIIISGANTSEYKILFLFIIITTTIQSGMKQGMIFATISSVIVLAIDMICMPNVQINKYFENDLILVGVFFLTAWPLGFYVKIEGEHIERLRDLANEDGLTGVYNHRYFFDALEKALEVSKTKKEKLSVIFIDIDYFKNYNDLYGHQEGDKVLKKVGEILKESIRHRDIVARYGGEEFAIILPNTNEIIANEIAESIRKNIETEYFYGQQNQPNGNLTVSIGISIYPDKAKDELELIKSADDALYRAKFFNKNRVETYASILEEIKRDISEDEVKLVTSIKTLISVINAKDRYTYGHCERVVLYSRLLANKLNLNEEDKNSLIYGAYMHDVGKINIAKEILIKRMPLNNDEWNTLKEHPQNGVDIIKPVTSLKRIEPIVLHHHEKYDGTGYPKGLKGEDIPYLARVLTVVDSFDAMTSNRPYNKRKTYEEGIEELRKWSGRQFDPEIADKFIEVIKENKDKLGELPDH
ncbi:diguanylate cyclase [Clostridium sp. Ade.TY]|uniref:bifunctional diguanylate cyclase/phosphohydrolase n=1 Tax=Clostridium sp. Ade.TY TaxID=1391647 RepID=UPI0004261345|nr:diguanylate cyclase [Clostridium sp. Ade.TY]